MLKFLSKIYFTSFKRSFFCFFFCAVVLNGYGQKLAKTLAPQYQWEYSYSATPPSTPFDSLHPRTPFQNWALGYAWEKPFPDRSVHNFYLNPILPQININRVQGFEASLMAHYKVAPHTIFKAKLNYGFSDRIFRPILALSRDLNSQHTLSIIAGNELRQFNQSPAIVPRANSINNLFFRNNYAKFYAVNFLAISHYFNSKNAHAFMLKNKLSIIENSAVYNNQNTYLFNRNEIVAQENNTISPIGIASGSFESFSQIVHELVVQFGRENESKTYFSHLCIAIKNSVPLNDPELFQPNKNSPDMPVEIYRPHVNWSFQHKQMIETIALGSFKSFVQVGGFIRSSELPFTDLKHFNGNETSVMRGSYLEVFGLLPYYKFSANGHYFQGHFEQNFNGFLWQKLPFIKKLNLHTIVSFKTLHTQGRNPYQEFAIGLGNIGVGRTKILRVDFFKSLHKQEMNAAVRVGLVY
ncbi:DUF5686 family protein [Flavobacteriaceae bacterium]|nr:DUF5686 family protein [Flavobacteriaceae bacterium]